MFEALRNHLNFKINWKINWIGLSVIFGLALSASANAKDVLKRPQDFQQAKKIVYQLFNEHPRTLYTQCAYDAHRHINIRSCCMQHTTLEQRKLHLEIEHMMPMANVTRQFPCGREKLCRTKKGIAYGGRRCCQKTNARYRFIEAELYNLWPAVSVINQARKHYRFTQFNAETRNRLRPFSSCDFWVNSKEKTVEPCNAAKGIVARANLFMADQYDLKLSNAQRKLLEAWNKQHAPDDWEKKWHHEISKIEGYVNLYIANWK